MLMKKLNVIIEVPEDQITMRKTMGFVPYDLAAAKRRKYEMQMMAIKEGATDVIAYEKLDEPEEIPVTKVVKPKMGRKKK